MTLWRPSLALQKKVQTNPGNLEQPSTTFFASFATLDIGFFKIKWG